MGAGLLARRRLSLGERAEYVAPLPEEDGKDGEAKIRWRWRKMARSEEPETSPKSPVPSSAARRRSRMTLAQGYGIFGALSGWYGVWVEES